jgi:hypothetical protein
MIIDFIKAYEQTLKDNEENKLIVEGNKGSSAGSLSDLFDGTISNVFRLYHTRNINDGMYRVIGGYEYRGHLTLQLDMEDLEYLYNKYYPKVEEELKEEAEKEVKALKEKEANIRKDLEDTLKKIREVEGR